MTHGYMFSLIVAVIKVISNIVILKRNKKESAMSSILRVPPACLFECFSVPTFYMIQSMICLSISLFLR